MPCLATYNNVFFPYIYLNTEDQKLQFEVKNTWIILNNITIKKQNLILNFKNLYRKWSHARDFSALFYCCVPVFLLSILYLAKTVT